MSARFKSLKPLLGEQALAADPQVHAALSASAGTGKTQVLTARVLRLLLNGARPESSAGGADQLHLPGCRAVGGQHQRARVTR